MAIYRNLMNLLCTLIPARDCALDHAFALPFGVPPSGGSWASGPNGSYRDLPGPKKCENQLRASHNLSRLPSGERFRTIPSKSDQFRPQETLPPCLSAFLNL